MRRSWKFMVEDSELEYPACASKWPILLGMVKIMKDLPDAENEAGFCEVSSLGS